MKREEVGKMLDDCMAMLGKRSCPLDDKEMQFLDYVVEQFEERESLNTTQVEMLARIHRKATRNA